MHKNKTLVSLVVGLGIIIVGGLVVLGYGLNQRASNPDFKFFKTSDTAPAKVSKASAVQAQIQAKLPTNVSIPLAQGSWVREIETSGDKIIVHIINEAKRDRILILDAETGAVLRRIRFDHKQ